MFLQKKEGVIISLFVQPNATKSVIVGPHNDQLKIKIKSPPVDGKANDEVIRFLSEVFSVAKNKIELISGQQSRQKKVFLKGLSVSQIQAILNMTEERS